MAYVQITDNEVNQLSGLSLAPGIGTGAKGYWANYKLRSIVPGTTTRRPGGGSAADWRFFPMLSQAQSFAATGGTSSGGGGVVVPAQPPTGGGGIVVPVKPPIIGGPVTPPGIPPESKPGGANYRFEGNSAYPLTAAGANTVPPALTNAAGYTWTKRIFPIERYGFIWEWKFVPAPSQVVIGPPIVSTPPPGGGSVVVNPGGDRPNIIPPPPGSNVYEIGPNDQAGQYYNITTGQVKQGRRVAGPQAQSVPPPPVRWYSYPPDDSGNWLVRDEAVRQGYISMTGNAGVQVSSTVPVDTFTGTPTDQPQQAGMNPWLIGGLAVAALLMFSGKGKAS
jgi:hypothetical protein